jgi:hypothetical protein
MMMGRRRVRGSARSWRAKVDPAHARQHPVEQHQIGQRLLHFAPGRFGIRRQNHAMTGALQVDVDQGLDRGFVFNNQNACGHGLTVTRGVKASVLQLDDGSVTSADVASAL